jgi:serine/threonine-protein kinase
LPWRKLMSEAKEQNNKRSKGKGADPNQSINGSTPGPGSQIGHFRIEQELGRGGGGVVYLAHDTKLGRSVAIKSLPPGVVDNPEILSRFTREAQTLASLNHPNIATIYDEIEEAEGTSYLVLEYVPGQTLAERIAKGPLDLEEALTIASQIAEAVVAAHEHNVIHRDLKPGNIKITPEDKVKVLDFGLAKEIYSEVTDQQSTVTMPGRVIGTPAYMSPEQARGKPTDKRSDIWSFGCMLYEMLTATIPFKGETVSDTLANILHTDPDWQALPQSMPVNIRSLIRRCLEKDPRRRLQHIGDAGIEIHETLNLPAVAPPIGVPSVLPSRSNRWRVVALSMFVGLVVGAIAMHLGLRKWIQSMEPKPVRRYSITLHPEDPLWPDPVRSSFGITFSPDGHQLIYVAGTAVDTWLVARSWDSIEGQRIRGTEGAQWPAVSPDGRWLTFTTRGAIWKVPIAGGTPERITDNPFDLPFVWEDINRLILSTKSPGMDGLYRFDLRTLESEPLTMLDATPGVFAHAPIQFDPESGTLFFIAARGYGIENYSVYALALESRQVKPLVERAVGFYAPSGHLVYAQKGRFMAAPFDTKTLQITGPAIDIMEKRMVTDKTVPSVIFSRDGTLVYSPAGGHQKPNRELVWVDFEGREDTVGTGPMRYARMCLSGDRVHPKVAVELFDDPSIWIYDLTGANPIQPLIFSSKDDYVYPVWMLPDNREIIFASHGSGSPQLYRKAADGSGEAEALLIDTSGMSFLYTHDCTPDGNVLLATTGSEENPALDLLAIHLEYEGQIEPLLLSDVRESHPALSKDGKWLAYVCIESIGARIFVTSYPDLEGKWLVSSEYGYEPVWAPDDRAIYYRDGTSVVAVPVQTEGGFSLGRAQALFEDVYVTDNNCRTYDIHPDGKRFLMMKRIEEDIPLTELIVVENWFEELRRRVPTGKN